MAQQLKQPDETGIYKPEKIKLNILTNDGKTIKIKVKLRWTIHELKEHLYGYNYFGEAVSNQIISLHGADLQNSQTLEDIYDAIKNKGSKGVLRSIRGQLTWEDNNNLNIDDLHNDDNDDNDDNDNNDNDDIQEISLYIRPRRKPKRKLITLTSNEPIIQEFVENQLQNRRQSAISVKSVHSEQSSPTNSSSSGGDGYGATKFDPDMMRKKQERKALKHLIKPRIPQSPQSPQILLNDTPIYDEKEKEIHHKPSASVIFHASDDDEYSSTEQSQSQSNTKNTAHSRSTSSSSSSSSASSSTSDTTSSSSSSTQISKTPPHPLNDNNNDDDDDDDDDDEEKKDNDDDEKQKSKTRKKSKRRSLFTDISHEELVDIPQSHSDTDDEDKGINKSLLHDLKSHQHDDDDDDEHHDAQSPLTQQNLYMHTRGHSHGHNRRKSGLSSVGSWTGGGSIDWGGGPFIVKRMSIGSSVGLPTNLSFYHAQNSSTHLWELELPDYYDDVPDSLQRIHNKLDRQTSSGRESMSMQIAIPPVDEEKVLQFDDNKDDDDDIVVAELKENDSSSTRRSVRFNQHVVYKSDDTGKLGDDLQIIEPNINDDNEQNVINENKEEEIISSNIKDKEEEKERMIGRRESVELKEEMDIMDEIKEKEEEIDRKKKRKISLDENVNKWKIKQVGVDSKYVDIRRKIEDENDNDINDDKLENENESESEYDDDEDDDDDDDDVDDELKREFDSDDIKTGIIDIESSSHSTSRSNGIYDDEVVQEDKLRKELTWKTSYIGIGLIGSIWCSAFHCLYSFSSIVSNVVTALNVKLFEFGLMYSFNFIGVGIGLFISSYLLNKPQWIDSSQIVAKNAIFIVFITQLIAALIFIYEYIIDSDQSPNAILWIILVISRFIMGIAIGFVESSVNNLVFEWFSDDAFNAKLSDDTDQKEREYLAKLSSRVLSYCLFLKEFGHISSRLFLVPMIYLTFSNNTTLFVPLLLGVIISGLSWIGMIYAGFRDKKTSSSYQQIMDSSSYDIDDDAYYDDDEYDKKRKIKIKLKNNEYDDDAPASDNDSESTPLLNSNNNNNKKLLTKITNNNIIPEDWSYSDWYDMGLIGLNKSVILSILFLSINFGISFSFTILSITNIVQQYQYTDYTSNLLICLIPISTLFGSNWLRQHILSKFDSVWTVMFIGCILYIVVFGLFAFCGLSGPSSIWLPILCVIIFILGSECVFASGYELLLSSAPEYIHGLISGINSSINFIISGISILIFSVLVIDYNGTSLNIINQYRWAYGFCCFASIINTIIAIILRYSFGSNVQHLLQ